MGWQGIKARHKDGRTASVKSDYEGFLHRVLSIQVNGGRDDSVQLNANGPDTGSPGWEWHCEDFSGGPKWLPLGDHAAVAA